MSFNSINLNSVTTLVSKRSRDVDALVLLCLPHCQKCIQSTLQVNYSRCPYIEPLHSSLPSSMHNNVLTPPLQVFSSPYSWVVPTQMNPFIPEWVSSGYNIVLTLPLQVISSPYTWVVPTQMNPFIPECVSSLRNIRFFIVVTCSHSSSSNLEEQCSTFVAFRVLARCLGQNPRTFPGILLVCGAFIRFW